MLFAGASDFDRAKTDANSHIQSPAGGMICCYRGQQRQKKEEFSSQCTVGIEPSAVEAVVLNRCMPTDFTGCIPWSTINTDFVAKTETEWQVGCVSYFRRRGDHSSVLLL